ncbi:MAG: DUF5110 domain-containing protein [Bacteroidales bacterium]|nr:DUF5110 domain-containing protein [Bacteroidales bacterium]MBN2698926.1 DUF5110 domain-containing protein [Bacteroidales bacterium]
MKRILLGLILLVSWMSATGQPYSREVKGFSLKENSLEIVVTDGLIVIKPRTEKIFEVVFIEDTESGMDSSYAVVLRAQDIQILFTDHPEKLIYETNHLKAIIYKSPYQIQFEYDDQSLVHEQEGFFRNDSLFGFAFYLQPDEVIYGGGLRALGMNRRGHRLELYNKPSYGFETFAGLMYYSMPLVVSSKKYMILFDNVPKGAIDVGAREANILTFESTGGRSSYCVLGGSDFYELVSEYTLLTGRQPLPPRWLLGNFASRFGYHSGKEVRNTIRKFIRYDIPVDAVVIDIYWFGKDIQGHMGNLEWDGTHWPEPERMMADLKKRGIKTILITEPFILTTSRKWDEAASGNILATDTTGNPYTYDFYFGRTGLLDIFKPEARDWFWDIYRNHTESGVDGWWGDLGEPEYHPSGMVHVNGMADEVHNAYGHEWAKLIYDGYRKDFPEKRPFTLMRSGYAGSQRYGMIPWSGDVNRTWGGLQSQPEIALQMGMQGLGYAHSDLGGFAGDYRDRELYIRWFQYGIFQPVFRPHAQKEVPSEPVFWDRKTRHLAREAVEMRYKMLPYNYTLAFENSVKGYPLMRPLFYEMEDGKALYENASQYFWGEDFFVVPVLNKGQDSAFFRLPPGNSWTDFYSGERYEGGTGQSVKLEEDHIPVYVRGGAFIPLLAEKIMTTDDYSSRVLEIHYYHDPAISDSEDFMYDDDGITYDAFRKGQSEQIIFSKTMKEGRHCYEFISKGEDYPGRPSERKIELIVHNPDRIPATAMIGGEDVKIRKRPLLNRKVVYAFQERNGNLVMGFTWKREEDLRITHE